MASSSSRFQRLPSRENHLTTTSICRQGSQVSRRTSFTSDDDFHCRFSSVHDLSSRHAYYRLKAKIYNFLERPSGIYCFLYHFTVLSLVIGCLVYSSILTIYTEHSFSLFWLEFILFVLLFVEYIVRIWSAGCRVKYQGYRGYLLFMRKTLCVIDLCVIIGYAVLLFMSMNSTQFTMQHLRYVRILQILRFLHIDRRLTSWRLLGSVVYDHRYELVATLYFSFIFLIVVSYLIWLVERNDAKAPNEDMFHSFADTLWWAIVTMTTIGYGDKYPITHTGKMITSCLCICGVAFWTLPSGIIGSGFALKVEEKKREEQYNRLVPAAASLVQNWWRLVACHREGLKATWKIYRIETKRINKLGRHAGSAFTVNISQNINGVPSIHNKQCRDNISSNNMPFDKISWRHVKDIHDLFDNQIIAIRMIRIIKFHVARRKFCEAHKPYGFKDIMDENARANIKVIYALSDMQRRLDQMLGSPKSHPTFLTDKEKEKYTLISKVQRLEVKLNELEGKTNHIVSLLENLCMHLNRGETITLMNRIPAVAEEMTSGK